MKKYTITSILVLFAIALQAQTWVNVNATTQRRITGADTALRHVFGSAGFAPFFTKKQVLDLLAGVGTYGAGTGLQLSGNTFSIDNTVVTLNGTQTLTNKTLTNPTINSTVNITDATDKRFVTDAQRTKIDALTTTPSASSVTVNNTGWKVLTGSNVQTALNSADIAIFEARNTGVYHVSAPISGLESTQVTLPQILGGIVDVNLERYKAINYAGATVTPINANGSSFFMIDSLGALRQTTTIPTELEHRLYIQIGYCTAISGVVKGIVTSVNPIQQTSNSLNQLSRILGQIKTSGLALSAPTANLNFAISSGTFYNKGANMAIDENNPDSETASAYSSATTTFRPSTTAGFLANSNTIDVGFYQSGGVRTAIPNPSSNYSNFYIFRGKTGIIYVAYSRNFYSNASNALASLSQAEAFACMPAGFTRSILFLVGAITVSKNETNLQSATTYFTPTDLFGGFNGAVATMSGNYLVASNNLSDLTNVVTARTNLGVYSTAQVDAAIATKFTLPSLTSGSVLFSDGTTIAQDNANFDWDNTTKRLGLRTNTPTHDLTIGSGGNGFSLYSTADQTTNFERLTTEFVGGLFQISHSYGGTGTQRRLRVGTASSAGGGISTVLEFTGTPALTTPNFNFIRSTTASCLITGFTGTLSGAGTTDQILFGLTPTITQGTTARNRVLYISPFYSSNLSTNNLLMDVGTNSAASNAGTHTSLLTLDNAGVLSLKTAPTTSGSNTSAMLMRNNTTGNIEQSGTVISGSATLDFPSTPAQSSSMLTITATGVADGDPIMLGIPNGSVLGNSTFVARCSATNTITVTYHNYSSVAQDPPSGTFKFRVVK